MHKKPLAYLALLVGAAFGVFLSHLGTPALASRNSSGTYSLPAGQPVVSGTTITSATHNSFASDIATELTASLDRSGRGAMLAPLQLTNGTVAAPSLTFGTDADTGFYRVASNNPAITAGGVKVFECLATGCTFPLLSAHTGAVTTAAGITATQSASNSHAITTTGNGTGSGAAGTGGATGHGFFGTGGSGGGSGIVGQGGATSGSGGTFTGGASNGYGVTATGDGTGRGVFATGGDSSGHGGEFTGGAPNGIGAVGVGDGSGQGGYFTGGDTSGTGIQVQGGAPNGNGAKLDAAGSGFAVDIGTGNAKLSASNPASSTGFSSTLTPMNVPKAWARIATNAGSATTIESGFNVTNPQESGSTIIVDFVTDFSATPACTAAYVGATADNVVSFTSITTSAATVQAYSVSGAGGVSLGGGTHTLTLVCFGAN